MNMSFTGNLAESFMDSKNARKNYTSGNSGEFMVKNLSKSDLLMTEIAICEFILFMKAQLCDQVNVAITDLQECIRYQFYNCLWKQTTKIIDENKKPFDYEKYEQEVKQNKRSWEKAAKKSVKRILRILNKESFEFEDSDVDKLYEEKDKLVVLIFNKPTL